MKTENMKWKDWLQDNWRCSEEMFLIGHLLVISVCIVIAFRVDELIYRSIKNKAQGDEAPADQAMSYDYYDIFELREKAENGDATAQYKMGSIYDEGEVVSENDKEASRWYEMAARQGHEKSCIILSEDSWRGVRTNERDYATAERWLKLAVGHGGIKALYELGCLYRAQKNYQKAFECFLYLVKDKKYPPARGALANCYLFGRGTPHSFINAAKAEPFGYSGIGIIAFFFLAHVVIIQTGKLDFLSMPICWLGCFGGALLVRSLMV